jgi:succinate dehydrogenase / fumarate reductase cytochrome b subunit
MSDTKSPLSPHLSIYRWPITMTLSILHRVTGVALSVGLIILCAWLISAAAGAADYERVVSLLSTMIGKLMLIGFSFAFFFHLANGVRHLVWDLGYGFEKHQANASAWFVLLLAGGMTAAYWILL